MRPISGEVGHRAPEIDADAGGDGPLALMLFAVWVLALLEVVFGILRSEPATTDRLLAVPFALGVPFLLRDQAVALWRRIRMRRPRRSPGC